MSVTLAANRVNIVVVHCSATAPSQDIGVEEIREWHVDDNHWSDIGYHGVIRRNGSFEEGRKLHQQGAQAKGWNDESWGLCLIGGVDERNVAEQNFTAKQYVTLEAMLDAWTFLAGGAAVCGHRDLDSTHQKLKECPSFDVRAWYASRRVQRPPVAKEKSWQLRMEKQIAKLKRRISVLENTGV